MDDGLWTFRCNARDRYWTIVTGMESIAAFVDKKNTNELVVVSEVYTEGEAVRTSTFGTP